jgi:hypothetical protein
LRKPDRPERKSSRPRTRAGAQAIRRDRTRLAPVAQQIRDFLAGRTHGEALFRALYDPILDEPIPPRLRRLLPP